MQLKNKVMLKNIITSVQYDRLGIESFFSVFLHFHFLHSISFLLFVGLNSLTFIYGCFFCPFPCCNSLTLLMIDYIIFFTTDLCFFDYSLYINMYMYIPC